MKTKSFSLRGPHTLFLAVGIGLLEIYAGPGARAQVPPPAKNDTTEGTAAMQHKLDHIVVPRLDFQATPLTDAIERVRQESRRLDLDPDEAGRGINIFLKLPLVPASRDTAAATPGTPPTVSGVQEPTRVPVTLTLTNVSIMDALRLIAAQVGDKVKVEQYAVCIVPLSETTERLMTTEFSMPKQAFGAADESEGRINAKSWLESQGIAFPVGSSATYLPGSQKLVVRTTKDNVDRIKPLVASASAVISH